MSAYEQASSLGTSAANTLSGLGNSISEGLAGVRAKADGLVSGFSASADPNASSEFLQSNSIIAKFAFLIMVVFGFVVAFNLGINAIGYFLNGAANPYLVKGMIEGNNPMVVSQDPKKLGSVPLLRSDNQSTGLEFTWSVWLYITGTGSGSVVHYQNVFNKGNGTYNSGSTTALAAAGMTATANQDGSTVYNWDARGGASQTSDAAAVASAYKVWTTAAATDAANSTQDTRSILGTALSALNVAKALSNEDASGIASVNNGPGLYIKSHELTSSLLVVMDTVDPLVPTQQLLVDEVPINKWFHLAIRMENTLMDAYVNGTIAARAQFTAVPKQNYNDVNVCQNGGFDGKLSNLQYFSRALSAFAINNLVRAGPDTTMVGATAAISGASPYYIADSWFYSKIGSS